MRERILMRHIALQALEAIDDDSMTREDYHEWLEEMVMDVAITMSGGKLEDFDDARRIVQEGV